MKKFVLGQQLVLASTLIMASTAISGASAAPQRYTVATNLPGTTATIGAPAGFNPLTASDAQLKEYGFPPRPNAAKSPAGYAAWSRAMSPGVERVVPTLEQTSIFHGPARSVKSGPVANGQATTTSTNWSGDAIYRNFAAYTSPTFYYLFAYYPIPVPRQPLGTCSGGWDYSSEWVGIDGFNSSDVLQTGVEVDAYCNGSTKQVFYAGWYEWYPNAETRINGGTFPVGPGQDIFAEVWSTSTTAGHAYLFNVYANKSVTINFTAPSGTTLKGTSAEWVVERPSVGGGLATLTGYSQDFFAMADAYDFNGDLFTPGEPGSRTNYNITMVDGSSNALSTASNTDPDGIFFQAVGAAR